MYFPILRGRQFELLALRECIHHGILSPRIIPVVEPVKATSTYTRAIGAFLQAERPIAVIRNPQVGAWEKTLKKESNRAIEKQADEQFKEDNVISSWYVTPDLDAHLRCAAAAGIPLDQTLLLCSDPDSIGFYEQAVGGASPLYNLIPDKGEFRRRIRSNRILCEDHFPKQTRNIDYSSIPTEFFSADHLYYAADGYLGFSDYSVIGEAYSETDFAPYAAAIHIVYFDEKKALRIAHFVSDSNDDLSDPAKKFAEAVKKLVHWNQSMKLDTVGIRALEKAYQDQIYPGLGVARKYSIMHHLELIGRYLDGALK